MRCNICHLEYSSASYGGPGVCPACDCGIPPEVSRLRKELAEARSQANPFAFNFEEMRGALAEQMKLRADLETLIGQPPEGSHPDEWKPRAETWHQERLNWEAEVGQLRAHIAGAASRVPSESPAIQPMTQSLARGLAQMLRVAERMARTEAYRERHNPDNQSRWMMEETRFRSAATSLEIQYPALSSESPDTEQKP